MKPATGKPVRIGSAKLEVIEPDVLGLKGAKQLGSWSVSGNVNMTKQLLLWFKENKIVPVVFQHEGWQCKGDAFIVGVFQTSDRASLVKFRGTGHLIQAKART